MLAYIDSSVVLRNIFDQTGPSIDLSQMTHGISSELLRVECLRSADRFQIVNGEADDIFSERLNLIHYSIKQFEMIQISSEILTRASQSFPTALGTLDAIHLSTCLLYQEQEKKEVTLLSYDEGLKRAGKAMGLTVL